MKRAAWDRPGERTLEERLASQPTQSRLIDILTRTSGNRAALRNALCESCQRHLRATGGDHAARKVTIDVDSFPIQVHGHQPGAAYNGHYQETVSHPLLASYSVAGNYDRMQHGHRLGNGFVHAILRQGQVHTAQGVKRFLEEVVRKARGLGHVLDFRIDAGSTDGATLDFLTDEKLRFLGRIKSNAVLERLAAPHLTRPVGRPPKEGYEVVIELGTYQAESWRHAQRLLLGKRRSARCEVGSTEIISFWSSAGSRRNSMDRRRWHTTESAGRSRIASANFSRPSGRIFRTTTSPPTKPSCDCRCWPSIWRRCRGSNTRPPPAVAAT